MSGRRPKAPKPWLPPLDRPPRLLLVRLSALGDVLHALPVLSGLRAVFPDARIDWAVEDRHAGLLAARSDLDRIVVYPRRALSEALSGVPRPLRAARAARAFVGELRAVAYDAVLDLQGNLKSGVITRTARAAVRMGFDRRAAREGNHLFTTRRWLPPGGPQHRVARGLGLAGAFLGRTLSYTPPGFPVGRADEREARDLRGAGGDPEAPYVVLHPGTSGFGAFKRWPPDRFAAVARRLLAAGHRVLVTHGPGEGPLAAAVVEGAGTGPIQAVAPSSLGALAALIRDAEGFLSSDTGPLHLAGLLGTPLLGLFGPKDPAVYGPYGVRPTGVAGPLPTLTQPDVACRPCTLRRCADPLCMTTLAPDRVAEALGATMHAGS